MNSNVVSLSLEHSGGNDALLARVLVYEKLKGYSNVVQFSNPNGGRSSEYQGVGFQIEDIGNISLTPIIVARNVGTAASIVTVNVPYTKANGVQGNISLPPLQLTGGEMRLVNTNKIIQRVAQQQIKVASVEVSYDTAPGSVIVNAHTVSGDHNHVFRVPMWDPMNQRSPTGGYPWRIEATSNTETYIKNITDVEEDYIAFLVWENGGMYMIGQKSIAAHETVHIDVKELRDQQIPDERGRTIPVYISSGQLQWTLQRKDSLPDDDVRANLSVIGRSEQVDIENGIVNNYSCQNCCPGNHVGGFITPSSLEIEYGESAQFRSVEVQETCYGFPYEVYVSSNWTSSNSGMGSITGGLITPQTAGVSTIGASWHTHFSISGPPCPPEPPYFAFAMLTASCSDERRGGPSDETALNYEPTNYEPVSNNESTLERNSTGSIVPMLIPGCGSCMNHGFLAIPAPATLEVIPKVQKIQYQDPENSNYVDISDTLYVLKGTTVNFKAIPDPINETFPAGTPIWGGTSGVNGTGQLISVTFSTPSLNASDFKTVTATSVNSTVIANVVVYELKGLLEPEDMFDPNRNVTKFGLEELVDLDFESKPDLTATTLGGPRWTILAGTGILPPQDDGEGIYTAAKVVEDSTLKLEVLNGPSNGESIRLDIKVIAPTNARLNRTSNIRHTYGRFGGAFRGEIFLEPTDVSFIRLRFGEGEAVARATGYLASLDGQIHEPTATRISISNCTLVSGCRIDGTDTVETDTNAPTPYRVGTFLWDIPWIYFTTDSFVVFTRAAHTCNADAMGNAFLGKKNAGPFTIGVNDPTTSF